MPRRPARLERRKDGIEMALTYYFFWTLIFSKFALYGVLHVILQPGKKTRNETGSGWGSYGLLDVGAVS